MVTEQLKVHFILSRTLMFTDLLFGLQTQSIVYLHGIYSEYERKTPHFRADRRSRSRHVALCTIWQNCITNARVRSKTTRLLTRVV